MSDQTTPQPALPSFAARLLNMGSEKLLTTVAVALGTAGVFSSAQQTEFVDVGAAVVLYGGSWLWGYIKERTAHKTAIALSNAPAASPPVKA